MTAARALLIAPASRSALAGVYLVGLETCKRSRKSLTFRLRVVLHGTCNVPAQFTAPHHRSV